jgi:drug/metabolite transporter (DMT)-like permease
MKTGRSENAGPRRILSGLLVVLGAVLIFLAPETWAGVVLLSLGVVVELIGMVLGHRLSHDHLP